MSPSRPPPLQSPNPQRLYRSESHRVLAGVCGGLADYWDIDVVVVRLAFIALLLFAFPIAFFGYLALAISIPKRPENLPEKLPESRAEERQFWREVSHKPGHTVGALRHRLRQIDRRIQRLEKHVTSRAFAVDRALRAAAAQGKAEPVEEPDSPQGSNN